MAHSMTYATCSLLLRWRRLCRPTRIRSAPSGCGVPRLLPPGLETGGRGQTLSYSYGRQKGLISLYRYTTADQDLNPLVASHLVWHLHLVSMALWASQCLNWHTPLLDKDMSSPMFAPLLQSPASAVKKLSSALQLTPNAVHFWGVKK